jgi:MFS family permease
MGNPFLPLYARELGATEIVIGIIMSSFFLSRVFIEIPAGYISDRVGYRNPLILGFLVSALAAVVVVIGDASSHLMIARALWGLGSALFFNSSINVVVSMVEKENRGDAMGVFQGIVFIGSFMGAPIGGFLAAAFGFKFVFTVAAFILILAALIMVVSKELKVATSREVTQAQRGVRSRGWRDSVKAMQDYVFGVVCLTGFIRMFAMIGIFLTVLPLYLSIRLGFDVATIGILMGVRSIGMSVSNFLAGKAARVAGKPGVFIVSLLVTAITIIGMLFVPSFEVQAFFFLIGGMGVGILMPLLPVTITEVISPSVRGTAIGFFRTSFAIGAIIAPVLLTWISTVWGMEVCFYFVAVLLLFNSFFVYTLRGKVD